MLLRGHLERRGPEFPSVTGEQRFAEVLVAQVEAAKAKGRHATVVAAMATVLELGAVLETKIAPSRETSMFTDEELDSATSDAVFQAISASPDAAADCLRERIRED